MHLKNYFEKIDTFFRSKNLAIFLICLIIVFSIIGIQIPQKSQLKPGVYETWKTNHPSRAEIYEFIGFDHLFSSFIFISLAVLLFLNTIFCTKSLLKVSLKRVRQNEQFQKRPFIDALENHKTLKTEKKDALSDIKSVLLSSGYRISQDGDRLYSQKNRYGALGTPFFHLCIIFLIMAVAYGSTGRMEGDMRLIEGQNLSEDHGNYMFINEGPFFYENHQKFDIKLEKFFPDYKDETDTPRGPAGKLVILKNDKELKSDVVFLNHQMFYEGYTFLGNVYGMAPLLILTNPDGTVYSGSYITASDLDSSGRYVASFEMGNTGLKGGLMVYMTGTLTSEIAQSNDVKQTPILFLKIFDTEKEIYDGTLRLNQTIKIGDKYLGFYDVKYWSNFYVVKDSSTPLINIGFVLIILAIFMNFFIIPKRIWVELNRENNITKISIGGKADKFRSLYQEEFTQMINKIEERLTNGTD